MRTDETVLRRWRDLDSIVEPLGKLVVATAWDRERKAEKGLKAEKPREVPVLRPSPASLPRGS